MSTRGEELANELKSYLWKQFRKKSETLEQFEKRISGSYFSEEVLNFNYLLKLPGFNQDVLFYGNACFIEIFKQRSKSKVKAIQQKIENITDNIFNRNGILYDLLYIFYLEKFFKNHAKNVNSVIAPSLKSKIKEYSATLLSACETLTKILQSEEDLSDEFQVWFELPIRQKMKELGITEENLRKLGDFVQSHEKARVAELEMNKYSNNVQSKRAKDYTPLSRVVMTEIFENLKNMKIPAEEAKRQIADLFNLFGIVKYADVIQEYDQDGEVLDYDEVRKTSGRRIGNVIRKKR